MARPNRLIEGAASGAGRSAFVSVGEHQVPTDIVAYCAWLNERGEKCGMRWAIVADDGGRRSVKRIDDQPSLRRSETLTAQETQTILRNARAAVAGSHRSEYVPDQEAA